MKNIVLFVHIHSSGFSQAALLYFTLLCTPYSRDGWIDARVYVQIANKDDVQEIPMKRTYFETV